MKQKTTLRAFLALAGSSLLTLTYASATEVWWDSNGDATAGFGATAGNWTSAGTGDLWSTSPTGDGVGGVALSDYVTTTSDIVRFGNGTGPVTYTGATTISGTVDAGYVYQQSSHPTFVGGVGSTINFGAAGTYDTTNNNRVFPVAPNQVTLTTDVAGVLTLAPQRSLNFMEAINTAANTVLSTSPETIYDYPGRTKMDKEANLGLGSLTLNDGTLSMQPGFPYASLSALHAAHPISFTLNADAGLDVCEPDSTFTADLPINLGTGVFWTEASSGGGAATSKTLKLTSASNVWEEIRLTGCNVEIDNLNQLGTKADLVTPAGVRFGSSLTTGSTLSSGTLRISGNTITSLGSHPMLTTPAKDVAFDIVDATNTFTVDQLLDQTTGKFTKSGAGSLIINTTSTYTGATTVLAGTLLINGDNTSATGLTDVKTGTFLGGTGIIGGDVDIQANAGLTFDLSIDPGSHTPLTVKGAGGLEFKGASELTITFSGSATVGTYTLVSSVNPILGALPTTVNLPFGYEASAPYVVGNDLLINITSIPFFWDPDGATPGFGSAAGTWASTGTGNKWSTDPSGQSAVLVDYPTTTADYLCFGTPTFPQTGSATLSGEVNAGTILSASGTFGTGTINFGASGKYIRANDNGSFSSSTVFKGAGTSFTWQSQRNLNISNVDLATNVTGNTILQTSPTTPYPYPGRTVMNKEANFAQGGLVFDHGTIRMANGFPYGSLSTLDAAHPVSFTPNEDFGLEMVNSSFTEFTVDLSVNAGTGLFWVEGSRPIILTQPNTWGGVSIVGGNLSVSDALQLGIDNPSTLVRFGSGDAAVLSGGTLTITGTTLTNLGTRTFATTPDKSVAFDIVDAAHAFTLSSALEQASSTLTKNGLGTLVLSGAANTYTGATSVNAGTLALINGSHASPITVSVSASLGFEIGSATTSTSSVNLTAGTVKISNPGSVDGTTSYQLMTAAGGFTFTDIATQLGTVVTGYALELQNSGTELWLVPSGTAFDTWAGTGSLGPVTFDGDTNGDGVKDGLAFLLGVANPDNDANGSLPSATEDGSGNLVLTFNCLATGDRGTSVLKVEQSNDLATWTPTTNEVPDSPGGVDGNVTFAVDNVIVAPLNKVTATIGVAGALDGKLFGRLRGENP